MTEHIKNDNDRVKCQIKIIRDFEQRDDNQSTINRRKSRFSVTISFLKNNSLETKRVELSQWYNSITNNVSSPDS